MPTCRDIVTRALQQARIVSLGRDPKAKEAEAGLTALQGIYDGWVASGMFGTLTDVYTDEDYTAAPGERVFADGATVTLPDTVERDGEATVPYDLACVSINDGTWRHWIWDGAWVELSGLTLDDEAPLAARDKEGLAALLAGYLAEGYGEQVGPLTLRRGLLFQGNVAHKFGSSQDRGEAEYF